ncbi:MAG TPA: serine/threonine-protein kinase [Polyangiaceae bacterium]|nr:serine/threonine-protein kinase [Polyangiaceae bacterium]
MSAGRIIASKYCLLHELGRGGMGAVWLADHLTLRAHVAVKLIEPGLKMNREAMRRFEREARAAASLRSQHVVQVLDFGVDGDTPYLVMEFLEGESLGSRLARDGRLTPHDTWLVVSQVCRAITRAHAEGFVHRDLKPDNVFLVEDDPDFLVKVLDFGIAKALQSPASKAAGVLTQSGTVLGTPHYMSPEQAEGRDVDSRSDLWSLGIIAFECITGQLPFDGASLPALMRSICYDPIVVPSTVASVPPAFDAWFARATSRDLDRRFQSAKGLVSALKPILQRPQNDWSPSPARNVPRRRGDPDDERTLEIETFPGQPQERRSDARVSSSIPAGINGRRDIRHTALIHNASRRGALLATRHRCHPDETITLSLQLQGPHHGALVHAKVVRVAARANDSIWKFDVGVQFDPPLADALVLEIQRRAY